MMSNRVSELAMEALDWSYKKYQTDKSGYDREYWYAQRLARLVLEEAIEIMGVDSTLADGIMLHFGIDDDPD